MLPKLGVKLETLHPELAILEPIVDEVYASFGLKAIVTSTNDGKHGKNSYHYKDAAFDLRVKVLDTAKGQWELWRRLRDCVQEQHPGLYDIVPEDFGDVNAHIHCEPSPKLAAMMFPKEGE